MTTKNATGYAHEFPDYVLDVYIPDGFDDTSWHNDVCPSFCKTISAARSIILWTDYADKSLSEIPDSPRFALQLIDNAPWSQAEMPAPVKEFASDDYEEILATIRAWQADATR